MRHTQSTARLRESEREIKRKREQESACAHAIPECRKLENRSLSVKVYMNFTRICAKRRDPPRRTREGGRERERERARARARESDRERKKVR